MRAFLVLLALATVLTARSFGSGTSYGIGAVGKTGASGAGFTGATGASGTNGTNGVNDTTGATGASGKTGATGATGASGASGASGSSGATGASGTNGTNGSGGGTGATGASGAITGSCGSGAGYVTLWSGTTAQTCDSALFYDTSGKAFGVGTITPNKGFITVTENITGAGDVTAAGIYMNGTGSGNATTSHAVGIYSTLAAGYTGNISAALEARNASASTYSVAGWFANTGASANTIGVYINAPANGGGGAIGLEIDANAPGAAAGNYALYIPSQAQSYFAGNIGIGNVPTQQLDLSGDTIRLRTAKTPASSGATCATGEIVWDASYIYVCRTTNTWVRATLAAF